MKIAPADAAVYAACAERMFDQHAREPDLDERMAGWRIVGYLSAKNALFGAQRFGLGERVYYGFLARNNEQPASYAAVVRGTENLIEWFEDARFAPARVKAGPGWVPRGFYEIHETMHFTALGYELGDIAAMAIADVIEPGATVTVIGHSLGAALATYLTRELCIASQGRFNVQGQFFASPKCCDDRYAAAFHNATLGEYQVVNYIRDLVPHLPPVGYVHLPNTEWLQQGGVDLPDDLGTNHAALSYAARIRAAEQTATGELA